MKRLPLRRLRAFAPRCLARSIRTAISIAGCSMLGVAIPHPIPAQVAPPAAVPATARGTATPRTAGSSRVIVDSVDRLNRTGQWQAALTLARSALDLPSTEACQVEVGMLWALRQMGRYDGAAELLPTADAKCAGRDATSLGVKRREVLERVRRDVTPPALPPLPTTGLDQTAIDAFWQVVDTLLSDTEPSDSLWHSLFATPGYRLSFINVQPFREDVELAYRPSRRASRDSVLARDNDQAMRQKHFARALVERAALMRLADSLNRTLPVPAAVALAQKYLPAGATVGRAPPLVALAVFKYDAYASPTRGIVVDLVRAADGNLVRLLAHEFHHAYVDYVSAVRRPSTTAYDAPLFYTLYGLRNEGAADQIDKPYPMVAEGEAMVPYAKRYNEEYAMTRATLRTADSLMSAIEPLLQRDTTAAMTKSVELQRMFFSGGHPNGAYMMRTIVETFGMDSMYTADRNPIAFARIYAAAAVKRGEPTPWSSATLALFDVEEKRWARP
jgi:hypothetical protein